MAFVPVQGRSLDVWIIAFIRSIYSPTQFVWKKSADSAEMKLSANSTSGTQAVSNASIQLTQAPASSPTPTEPVPNTPTVAITPPNTDEPSKDQAQEPQPEEPSPPVPPPAPDLINISPAIEEPPVPALGSVITNLAPVVTTETPIAPEPTKQSEPVDTNQEPAKPEMPPSSTTVQKQANIPKTTPSVASQQTQLPVPFTPTTPNTLVGLTLTPEGKILDGVMVEIKRNGLTSRATKSNKLGQFMFARPLENGLYQILAEKDSYTFSPYSLDLTGEIIRPLKIQAQ